MTTKLSQLFKYLYLIQLALTIILQEEQANTKLTQNSTPLHHNYTLSLENQITQFKQYGHTALSKNKQTANFRSS